MVIFEGLGAYGFFIILCALKEERRVLAWKKTQNNRQ